MIDPIAADETFQEVFVMLRRVREYEVRATTTPDCATGLRLWANKHRCDAMGLIMAGLDEPTE